MVASSTPDVADASSIAPRHLVLLVLMNLVWGLNLIASKIGVAQLPPQFEEFLIVALAEPIFAVVIHDGDSQKIFQQFTGILPEQVPRELFPFGGRPRVSCELTDRVMPRFCGPFDGPMRISLGYQHHECRPRSSPPACGNTPKA